MTIKPVMKKKTAYRNDVAWQIQLLIFLKMSWFQSWKLSEGIHFNSLCHNISVGPFTSLL